jgi:hypothetical protein
MIDYNFGLLKKILPQVPLPSLTFHKWTFGDRIEIDFCKVKVQDKKFWLFNVSVFF